MAMGTQTTAVLNVEKNNSVYKPSIKNFKKTDNKQAWMYHVCLLSVYYYFKSSAGNVLCKEGGAGLKTGLGGNFYSFVKVIG